MEHPLVGYTYNAGEPDDPLEYPVGDGDVQYGYLDNVLNYLGEPYYDFGTSQKTSMTEITVGDSVTSYYHYDIQGRLARYVPSTKDREDYVIAYTYNNLGQKTSVKIGTPTEPDMDDPYYWWVIDCPELWWTTAPPSDLTYDVSYEYYANGWLKKLKSGANPIAEYAYDEVGNRTRTDNGNDTYTLFAYGEDDPRYSLTSITYKDGSNATLATLGYSSRDDVGNPLSMSDWTGSWAYTYDSMNRLDSATLSGVEGPPNPIPDQPCGGDYGYDWVGNRLNPPSGANHMVYDKADRLTSWPGMYSMLLERRSSSAHQLSTI